MKKLFKILLWIFGSLLLVLLLLVILLPVLVDPNDYKDEIAQQVYQQTGRTLTIEGDIDLAISLPLSVSLALGKIELSNAKGFTDKPFARMQDASIYVSIWPLITENRLNIGEIKLAGMELNLSKNKQGQTNWDDLATGKNTEATKPNTTQSTKKSPVQETGKPMPTINIAGLDISNAQINWSDEQAKQHISLSKTNINISELVENKPFDLELSTYINSNNPAIKGSFTFRSTPTVSLSQQLFKLPETLLTLDLTGALLPGGASKTTLGGDILFDGKKQLLDITSMKLTAYEMKINGLLKANKLNSDPQYNGQLSIEQFSPQKLAATLGAVLPKMKQANALSSANAKITFTGNQNKVNISSLEANLDDTSLKGSATINNFKKPHYGFDLALNQLNLDYYATATQNNKVNPETGTTVGTKVPPGNSPEATTDHVPAPSAGETQAANALFPLETLRQLNLNGKLSIGQFTAAGAKMSNVVIVLKGNNGLVQLAPLKASLYNGSINLNTDIDARSNTPKLKIVNELKNVKIGDLLQDTTGSQEFTGTANISTNITSQGNYKEQLIKTSNGTANLLVTDGHIKKLDIINNLRKAQALYRGTAAPSKAQENNTKFTELKGTLNIKNGVIHNNDLSSKSPVLVLSGGGYVDLPKEYVDYTLSITLMNSLKIDENSQGTDYRGKEIPYTIKGKFSEISQKADMSNLVKQEVKKKLQKELNKKLEEKLGEQFKGLLKF